MKEAYLKLQKEFDLPPFEGMDQEFEITSIEAETFLIREILKRMENRLDYLSSILEEILQPSPESVTQMHECRYVTNEEKERLFAIFKRLQYWLRAIVEAHVRAEDKKSAQLINDINTEWKQIKEQSLPFISRLKESWKLDDELKEYVEYFG